jgi:hypothetical protein
MSMFLCSEGMPGLDLNGLWFAKNWKCFRNTGCTLLQAARDYRSG